MSGNEHDTPNAWVDPADAPELTDEWFAQAGVHENGRLIRRGTPRVEHPKQRMTLRQDKDLLEALRASGRGWQTRVDAASRDRVKGGEEARSGP